MSFGAMAGWQALLLMAAAAALAVWLFRLKVRPPKVNVPSLLLWRKVFDKARELTWWERVRRAVSLAATVAIALFLAMAVTRPGPKLNAASRGRMLIVLDSSWSMRAKTSSGETRWDRALREAHRLAASSGGEAVALATTAEGLVEGPTTDLALIETALDRLTASGGPESAWPRVAGTDSVHFLTDGAVERPMASDVKVHSVYEEAPNVAITAFAARGATSGATTGEAYLEIANFSKSAQQVQVSLTRGSSPLFDQPVSINAGEVVRQKIALAPAGGARLVARVRADENALAVDDEAVAWLTGADPLTVTVVSDAPGPIVDLLKRDSSIRLAVVATAAYRPVRDGVLIFDRWLPADAPARPALAIAPPATAWLQDGGADERSPRWSTPGTHPVVAGVDPLTVDIRHAHAYKADGLVPVATSDRGLPLVSVSDARDRRFILLGFGIGESNLAMAPAFPVLIGNALEWLGRPSYGILQRSGPVALPASTARVVAPNGAALPLTREGGRVVARLTEPGLYQVDAGGSRGIIGVNVGDADISNLARSSLSGRAGADVAGSGSNRPWWMYAVVAAFVLALSEWWTWQRRITV